MNSHDWIKAAEREIARPIACEILGTCASTQFEGFLAVAIALGHEAEGIACEMAQAAWDFCATERGYVMGAGNWSLYYEVCAEAESLLQSGEPYAA